MGGRMRLSTAIEFSANAAERWRSQYASWHDGNKFADGVTKGQVDEALDSHQHTPENIAGIIDPGWAYPQCGACGERFEAVACMTDGWSSETFSICYPCARRAADMLIGHSAEHKSVPNGNRTGSRFLKAEQSA